tara:strand:+ start:3980 stop:4813 length:834 start_codon:yes stop_codon:yes gene_type:complete
MNNFLLNYFKILSKKNFDNPFIEIKALINNSRSVKNEIILSNFDESNINVEVFKKSFERRLKLEPISKIFNKKDFWDFTFFVNHSVLDPRPETELIIDTAKKYLINKNQKYKIADLGTGSGCLAICLAKEFCNSNIVATDISKKALIVAKKNSSNLKTFKQIEFINCDWINNNENFDLVVSNPPYLSKKEYENLSNEIKFYEPKLSLYGGTDGLDCYKKLAHHFKKIGHKNTIYIVEIGYNQKSQCIDIFRNSSLKCLEIIKDYQSHNRILVLKNLK